MMLKLHHKDFFFAARIIAVCLVWWTTSSAQSIVNKWALQHYPFPLTIALSSCLNNVIYAVPLISLFRINIVNVSTDYLLRTVVPISIGRGLAVTSAYFALWKVSVSYAQTVKATMPIFTLLISRLMLGEHHSRLLYASLLPIVIGLFIATATELQFDSMGLCSSLVSTGIFAFLNVLAKKVFDETGMHPVNLLALNSQLAALFLFPFWLLTDALQMWANLNSSKDKGSPDREFLFLLILSGLCSFLQNLCAFFLIHQLSALSYAVTNTAKRIFVILLSLLTLRNPVTPLNMFGMFLSVFGVFLYSRMKSWEHSQAKLRYVSPVQNGGHLEMQQKDLQHRRRESTRLDILHSSGSDVRLLLAND